MPQRTGGFSWVVPAAPCPASAACWAGPQSCSASCAQGQDCLACKTADVRTHAGLSIAHAYHFWYLPTRKAQRNLTQMSNPGSRCLQALHEHQHHSLSTRHTAWASLALLQPECLLKEHQQNAANSCCSSTGVQQASLHLHCHDVSSEQTQLPAPSHTCWQVQNFAGPEPQS